MDRQERIDEQLAKVPLFSGLSKKELRLISQLATYLEEPAGTVLTQEGKPGHEFIIILSGDIEVRQGNRIVAERGPGSYIGEIALLDHRPRTATVVAKTPVSIEVIGQREFADAGATQRGEMGAAAQVASHIVGDRAHVSS